MGLQRIRANRLFDPKRSATQVIAQIGRRVYTHAMNTDHLSPHDAEVVQSFENFLSWGVQPHNKARHYPTHLRRWPPAVYAYALGQTHFCPPVGTL